MEAIKLIDYAEHLVLSSYADFISKRNKKQGIKKRNEYFDNYLSKKELLIRLVSFYINENSKYNQFTNVEDYESYLNELISKIN